MDSTMSLMDADYSLFGGELLFPPPVASPSDGTEVVIELQDGLKTIPAFVETDDDNIHSLNVISNEAVSGDLSQEWLDTPVDLFKLFTEQHILPADSLSFGLNLQIHDVKSEETPGLEALKSLSEEIASELNTEAESLVVSATTNTTTEQADATGDVYDIGEGLLEELLAGTLTQGIDVSGIPGLDLMPLEASSPILSPVSPEDVETILSSGPASPVSCTTERSFLSPNNSLIDFTMMEADDSLIGDMEGLIPLGQVSDDSYSEPSDDSYSELECSVRSKKSRPTPYQRNTEDQRKSDESATSSKFTDRRMRKKQQNKDAATRYRQKKKAEQGLVNQELDGLQGHNTFLKDKVDQMTKEIQYLKNLLLEVQKAKLQREKSN